MTPPASTVRPENRSLVSRREFLRQSGALLTGAGLLSNPLIGSLSRADNDPVLEKVKTAIDSYMTKSAPVGLAVAIIRPGNDLQTALVNTMFRGEIRKGSGQAPDEKTIFELGSITKVFTGSLLADMVVNQKVVALDDDVQPYYDKLAPGSVTLPTYRGQTIKFWHLATHTAGFPDDPPNLKQGGPCQYTPALMYKALDRLVLPQAPGQVALYSNLGFGTLADVLCLVSGARPYEDVIGEFFDQAKLKMPDTHIMTADFADPRFAQGYHYSADGKSTHEADQCMPTWPAFNGAGALRSTLTDMIEWAKFNLDISNLSPAPLSDVPTEALKPLHDFGTDEQIGLAWQLRPLNAQPKKFVATKNGGTLGFGTDITFFRETQTASIALTNTAGSAPTSLSAQIIEILNESN